MVAAFYVFGYISIPLCFIASVGNLLAIASILANKLYGTLSNQLLLNLFVNNALYAIFALPVAIYANVLLRWDATPGSCQFFAFLTLWLSYSNCCIHAAVALNRYLAVVWINVIGKRNLQRSTGAMVLVSWLFPCMMFLFPVFGVGGTVGFSASAGRCTLATGTYGFIMAYRGLFQIVPMIVIVVCYGLIVVKVRTVRRVVEARRALMDRQARMQDKDLKVEVKIARYTAALGAFFVASYLPGTIWSFIPGTATKDITPNLGPSLYLLMWIGNTCGYLLYVSVSTELRHATWKMLRRLSGRPLTEISHSTDKGASLTLTEVSKSKNRQSEPPLTKETTLPP